MNAGKGDDHLARACPLKPSRSKMPIRSLALKAWPVQHRSGPCRGRRRGPPMPSGLASPLHSGSLALERHLNQKPGVPANRGGKSRRYNRRQVSLHTGPFTTMHITGGGPARCSIERDGIPPSSACAGLSDAVRDHLRYPITSCSAGHRAPYCPIGSRPTRRSDALRPGVLREPAAMGAVSVPVNLTTGQAVQWCVKSWLARFEH